MIAITKEKISIYSCIINKTGFEIYNFVPMIPDIFYETPDYEGCSIAD